MEVPTSQGVHADAPFKLRVLVPAAHGLHSPVPRLAAYEPAAQLATHAVPCLYGLLLEHDTQSLESPPLQVPQSEWHPMQLPPSS